MTMKKPRGRPKGSGIDDAADLAKIADVLVSDPKLTARRAILRVMQMNFRVGSDDARLRRLQAKWHADHNALIAAAKVRARPTREASYSGGGFYPAFAGAYSPSFAVGYHPSAIESFQSVVDRALQAARNPVDEMIERERHFQSVMDRALQAARNPIDEMIERERRLYGQMFAHQRPVGFGYGATDLLQQQLERDRQEIVRRMTRGW
jgi:hypothetical protein